MRILLLWIVMLMLIGCNGAIGTITTQCDDLTITYTVLKNGLVVPDTILDYKRGWICKHDYTQSAQIYCSPIIEEERP